MAGHRLVALDGGGGLPPPPPVQCIPPPPRGYIHLHPRVAHLNEPPPPPPPTAQVALGWPSVKGSDGVPAGGGRAEGAGAVSRRYSKCKAAGSSSGLQIARRVAGTQFRNVAFRPACVRKKCKRADPAAYLQRALSNADQSNATVLTLLQVRSGGGGAEGGGCGGSENRQTTPRTTSTTPNTPTTGRR